MTLKEAYRYQNLIGDFIRMTTAEMNADNAMVTHHLHLRKQASADLDDYDEIVQKEDHKYSIEQLLDFACDLLEEKKRVSFAISEAKMRASKELNCDIDALTNVNIATRQVVSALNYVLSLKPTKRTIQGNGTKINLNGDQVPFVYNIEATTQLNYDRAILKEMYKKMMEEADRNSNAIDTISGGVITVNFEPQYSFADTFEDAIEQFLA